MPLTPTLPDLETLALMLGTQLVLTLYGAGLRRPFGSLRTVRTAPPWLRETPALVLAADLAFAAFVVAMWIHLFNRLDLVSFLISFFAFAAVGTWLSHRVALLPSFCLTLLLRRRDGVRSGDRRRGRMNDAAQASRTGERGPQAVRLLLPVWGQRYLRRFFEFSLPTMIAPGNIPALAAALPCTFVFLTSAQDAELIAEHPGYRHLSAICRTEIVPIDDLITGDNHSTTITLAYERAMRAAAAITDTCFLFLISDYLVADGSFRHVLARIQEGASGVLAGNFQVTEEDAAPAFHSTFGSGDVALTLAPRALAAWALRHLHPVTAANTVNFPLNHSLHSNRLFWRVDEDTLLGRFYLMHMIAIRPETRDFVIGASCDYSFIPELCPSGNVAVLTDSDDYLVVELQPRQHERAFLRVGPPDVATLAASLSEWTTARHRENARHSVLFHAAALPPALPAVAAEAERFIAEVDRRLSARPQPHRDHPYWLGAIAAHRLRGRAPAARRRSSRRAPTPTRAPTGRSGTASRR